MAARANLGRARAVRQWDKNRTGGSGPLLSRSRRFCEALFLGGVSALGNAVL